MAKVDKLALVRMALDETLKSLDTREKLCVLADLYSPTPDKEEPRWYGNGNGTHGLEQGIYNYMTTFRRVSNLWKKIMALTPDIKQETYRVRDLLVASLNENQINLPQEQSNE
jgi:hypothetical protein